MQKNRGIAFKLTFFILTSCAIIFFIIFGYNYSFSRKIILDKIKENADVLSVAIVSRIETVLVSVQKVPLQIANSLEYSSYGETILLDLLRSVIENNPEIYGSTIAYEPYAFDQKSLYFAPYFYKNRDELQSTYLGSESYRYFEWDWYRLPKILGCPVWSEPYYDKGGGNIIMSTYSVPFYKIVEGKRKFTGIVTADVSLAWLQNIVSSIKIGKTGYGFLISKEGTIVTHPKKDLILNETVFGINGESKFLDLGDIGKKMTAGTRGFQQFRAGTGGEKMWIFYSPIPSSGWSLGIVFPEKELMSGILKLNSIVFELGIVGFLFLFAGIFFIAGTITKPLRSLARATKDISEGNLDFNVPKIRSKDEIGQLSESFIYMKKALKEYIIKLTALVAAKERIESELKIAHDIQMRIVPKDFPLFPERKEIDVYAVLKPAKEVGGDFYDFFFIDDDRLCFVIADISGKGVPAALFMTVAKTLIKAGVKQTKSPAETIGRLNKEFLESDNSGIFLTVICGILNIRNGEVVYVNGGHNFPLIINENKNKAEFLEKGSFSAVGINEAAEYSDSKVILEPGEMFFTYTDGVTEAFNEKKEMFSEKRLEQEIVNIKNKTCRNLIEEIMGKVTKFSGKISQSDDITIMAIKYLKGRAITTPHTRNP